MLSISQNNICSPASAFKTINKIREHTMASVPLLPPSVSFSSPCIHSHFVRAHLVAQCRHSVVCLHLLSEGNFSTKPPFAGRDTQGDRVNTQGREFTAVNTFRPSAECPGHTGWPRLLPTCSHARFVLHRRREMNQKQIKRWLYKHHTPLEKNLACMVTEMHTIPLNGAQDT